MKLKFVSFAALSLTAAQATKLSKQFAPHDDSLVSSESIQSLENALKHQHSQENLLDKINANLQQYWDEADQSQSYVQNENYEGASTKAHHKDVAKAKATPP